MFHFFSPIFRLVILTVITNLAIFLDTVSLYFLVILPSNSFRISQEWIQSHEKRLLKHSSTLRRLEYYCLECHLFVNAWLILTGIWKNSAVGLSEKLNEVVGHDAFYLSMKSVTPQRRNSAAKETLVDIEFAKNSQRLALHIDRRTKRGNHSICPSVKFGCKPGQITLQSSLIQSAVRLNWAWI